MRDIDQDIEYLYANAERGKLKRPSEVQEDEFIELVGRYVRSYRLTATAARLKAFKEIML
jgi:hypothetical protein